MEARVNKWRTAHFSLEEFTRSSTAKKMGIDNTPDARAAANLFILASQVLEPARAIIGNPVVITSGYRCEALNKAVGGVNGSYHKKGMAADIRIENRHEAENLAAALIEQPLTDIVLLEHSKTAVWLHVQFRYTNQRHYVNLNYRA